VFSIYVFRVGYTLFPAIYHLEQEILSQGCLWLIQWSEWPFLKFVNINGSKLAFPVIWPCPHQIQCNKLKRFSLYFYCICMKRFVKQFSEPLTVIAQIDEEILQEVINMGFDRNQLIESLRNRMQNEVWSFWNSVIGLLELLLYTIIDMVSSLTMDFSGYCCLLFVTG